MPNEYWEILIVACGPIFSGSLLNLEFLTFRWYAPVGGLGVFKGGGIGLIKCAVVNLIGGILIFAAVPELAAYQNERCLIILEVPINFGMGRNCWVEHGKCGRG